MKILIIEDEILIQKTLLKLLQREGAEVTATARGEEAITLILENNFDLVLCDLMLQDITGFDVIEESKKRYSIAEIRERFIIMTAYSSQQVLQRANQYGCQILSKPFQSIQDTIVTIMKRELHD